VFDSTISVQSLLYPLSVSQPVPNDALRFTLFRSFALEQSATPLFPITCALFLCFTRDDAQSVFPKSTKSQITEKKGSSKMNPQTQTTQPAATSTGLPRCSHRSLSGRHCRAQARDSRSGLCPRHYFRPPVHQPDPSLAAELLGPLTEFQSASDVNAFLSRLLLLLAQDRVSPRRGAVMAYTCNLLLRSLRAMDLEFAAANADDPGQLVIADLPRGRREDYSEPTRPHPFLAHRRSPHERAA
jgi:hypothetical protein